MRKSRVLVEVEADAGLPYEQTALARRAIPARRRLSWLLLATAAAMLIEAAVTRTPWWPVGSALVGAAAWGVSRGRLGATIGAAFVAALAIMLPLRLFFVTERDFPLIASLVLGMGLGVAMLPDIVTLVRDHELQNAFGLWARRK